MQRYTIITFLILLLNDASFGFQSKMGCAMRSPIHQQWERTMPPQKPSAAPFNKISHLYSENKTKGVYSRPSAAIERGSGFYIPGLEGSRVRLLFGGIVLLLTYLNGSLGLGDSNKSAVEFSQIVSICFGILLLLQGSIEFAKEYGLGISDNTTQGSRNQGRNNVSSTSKSFAQYMSERLQTNESISNSIAWSMASFVALTPTTHVLLLEEKDDGICEVMYSLGDFDNPSTFEEEDMKSALITVYNSKGGRVAVNESHPTASLLPEGYRRSIILQKVETLIGSKRCLVVGSNELLASYTKNDLKWLGAIARYIKS